MSKCKSLLEYTNLFSPDHYAKNDKIILKYFQQLIALYPVSTENLENLKYHTCWKKHQLFLSFAVV